MSKPAEFNPRDLADSLDRITAWHQTNAPAVAASLQPGLTRKEIESLARKHKIALPEEVYALYQWHNGMSDGHPLFDVYRFVPLAEMFDFSEDMRRSVPGLDCSLTIFQSILSSDGYQIGCPKRAQAQVRVDFFLEGSTPSMDSVTALMQAVAAAFENGAFKLNQYATLDTDGPVFERALLNFRPRRKADVEALLRGESIPLDREIAACWSLIQTANPRAEEIVSKALPRWINADRGSRFSGLEQIAQLHTDSALAVLQKAALDPRREVRRAVYSVLAWRVQWANRRLDESVVDVMLADLLDPEPGVCDHREIARALRWSPNRRPVPWLIKLLNEDADACARDTRIAAAQGLGGLGDASAISPLAARLAIETDAGTQFSLTCALADLGDEEGERRLRARMETMDRNSLCNMSQRKSDSPAASRIAQELLAPKNESPAH